MINRQQEKEEVLLLALVSFFLMQIIQMMMLNLRSNLLGVVHALVVVATVVMPLLTAIQAQVRVLLFLM